MTQVHYRAVEHIEGSKRSQPAGEEHHSPTATDGNLEEEQRLVDTITAPGGVRAAPGREQIDHFIKRLILHKYTLPVVCVRVCMDRCVCVSVVSICGFVHRSICPVVLYYRCKSLDVLVITDLLREKLRSQTSQVVLVSIYVCNVGGSSLAWPDRLEGATRAFCYGLCLKDSLAHFEY